MKPREIKRVARDAIVDVPADVGLEAVIAAVLGGAEGGPVAVEGTAALLGGDLYADCVWEVSCWWEDFNESVWLWDEGFGVFVCVRRRGDLRGRKMEGMGE